MKLRIYALLIFCIWPGLMRTVSASTLDRADLKPCYEAWKKRYLRPSVRFPRDRKVAFNHSGVTVSEAMGYGMLLTVLMADKDPSAKELFEALNRFRKRFPSKIEPEFMSWKIPANESLRPDDSATDGDMDMALALLLAHRKWGEASHLAEAKRIIHALAQKVVRRDNTLRLGDWDTEQDKPEVVRISDLMPVNFRAFGEATGDELWSRLENRSYSLLNELQQTAAPETGLAPDFAIQKNGRWIPAPKGTLEGVHDGDYSYNACRMPWRIGWAALTLDDERARSVLRPLMHWAETAVKSPEDFKAGYHLDGQRLRGADFDSPCFISPTGVAALATGNRAWSDAVWAYGIKAHEGYYEDSVNLLSLIVMKQRTESSVQ